VHIAELTPPEQRVLGCLIEKRWTTPDQYPLSLNALRLACNQSTNRDPVTAYDEHTVREAAQRLSRYGLARLASYHGSRAIKYRHLAEEALGLGRQELAVLAVLLLRGPQTPGELKARGDRMATFSSLEDLQRVLDALIERGYVRRLHRRPGQKEDRFEQLLGGEGPDEAHIPRADVHPDPTLAPQSDGAQDSGYPPPSAPVTLEQRPVSADGPSASSTQRSDLADRVAALEAEVAALRDELATLRADPLAR
jgi:uncharacterized protein